MVQGPLGRSGDSRSKVVSAGLYVSRSTGTLYVTLATKSHDPQRLGPEL